MQTLRPYQADVIARVRERIAAGQRRVLLVAPTGAGKTVIAASFVRDALAEGKRVLFLAHRRELITQAARKLHELGCDHGVLLPGHATRLHVRLQIASVATLHARAVRSHLVELPPADTIVLDEAHHVRARTYLRLLEQYPAAIVLGLTATPVRGDGRGLGNVFNTMVECPAISQLIGGGYLVPTRVYAPTEPDLKGVQIQAGDYAEAQLAERMDRPKLVGDVVEHWLRLAQGRKTVVFATGVQHSVHLRDEFRRSDIMAEHIDGATPPEQRDAILAQLAAGRIEVVTNAMILTEGWDQPDVSCLILARPTKSLGLYRQMVGRVLRPFPGKTDALILDHAGATLIHGYAEDNIEWALDTDRRAVNHSQAARGRSGATTLTTCPECSAIRNAGDACPRCGWQPARRAAPVAVADGDLVETRRGGGAVPPAHSPGAKEGFYRQLLWIAREKNYKAGWAAQKFREKFHHWPATRSWDLPAPEPPEAATRAWVRSRAIAFAKSAAGHRRRGSP